MTRDDLFKINAGIVRDLAKGVAEHCPKAFVLVISNPVNSTVPIAAEMLKAAGVFDAKRLFGVTTLDVVRAETFVQDITGERDPTKTVIPVIGGHSGETIVPLFSQAKPPVKIPEDKLDTLVNRKYRLVHEPIETADWTCRRPIRWRRSRQGQGWSRISNALHGIRRLPVTLDRWIWKGSRKLIPIRFAEKVIKAVKGEKGIVEPTYIYLPGVDGGEAIAKEAGVDYFSVPVELGVRSQQLLNSSA